MFNSNFRISGIILITLISFIFLFRISNVTKKEISWDVLGYYLYLPATFIQNDPMLHDISWLKNLNKEKDLSGTLYQLSSNDKGEPMYFFLMGMSLFYLPWFLFACLISFLFGLPIDGFSSVFQYCLVIGGIVYTGIGLIYFRKILNNFFNDLISSLVLCTIVIGTNYIHHLTLDNLATVNILFMLCSILVWNTICWHKNNKPFNLIIIGLCVLLMGLVKPSEIIVILLPLLWNIYSFESLKQKGILLQEHWKTILITLGICLIIAMPQLLYWHSKTGKFIFDSYKNPGVGLDIFAPHTFNTLFSYRKGWLLYTPVMIFSLVGFYYLYKKNRQLFLTIFVYFIISFYIISSWSEWWYGAAYSTRPMITLYPVLGICLGYFIQDLLNWKTGSKILITAVFLVFIFLNQFQWWQFRNGILDPYRMTKDAYWSIFLNNQPDPEYKNKLLVERDFTGGFNFKNRENYNKVTMANLTFEDEKDEHIKIDSGGNSFYRVLSDQEFSKTFQYKFKQLTDKDHVWIEASVDLRFSSNKAGQLPLFIMSTEYKGKVYGYHASEIKIDSLDGNWHTIKFDYLTPEIRSNNDIIKCYIWNNGKMEYDMDNFKFDVYEHK